MRTLLVAGVLALASLTVMPACSGREEQQPPRAVGVPGAVNALENQLVRVVRAVSPSIVQIEAGSGLGSGVVYDNKGHIVTNAHVVAGARAFTVTLRSGERRAATLVGAFPTDDLAVIRTRGAGLRPAAFASSSKVEVGDIVLAIGNPLGLRSSVTDGIVSSLGRTVSAGSGVVLPSVIQTSAPINPGNSGGALVDLRGRVIGIPTLAALVPELGGSLAPGIGFAIPSDTVRKIADQLIRHGRVRDSDRAFLGVRVTSIVGGGVLVARVDPGGPAARAGIRVGMIIVAVANTPTPTADVLVSVLARLKPGQRVPVDLLRPDGRRLRVTVTLGELEGG
jgi:S1-C subfamily serine protease